MRGSGLTKFFRVLLVVVLSAAGGGIAAAAPAADDGEEQQRPAVEKEVAFPAFPAKESLIPVYA